MAAQSKPEGLAAVGLRGATTAPVKAGIWMKIWVPAPHRRAGIYRWKTERGALRMEYGHPFLGWTPVDLGGELFLKNLLQNSET